ncbi:MAG: rubredoxin [Methanomicrobiaceae archaeon]|nr:rubredoxin [Methanomicrobiaceae archaeon]
MAVWKCKKCGYLYDESIGDAKTGIKAGTKFEDIPSDWVCSRCGAGKNQFIRKEST